MPASPYCAQKRLSLLLLAPETLSQPSILPLSQSWRAQECSWHRSRGVLSGATGAVMGPDDVWHVVVPSAPGKEPK